MNAVEVYDLSASAVEESQKTLAGDCFSRRISRKGGIGSRPLPYYFWDLGFRLQLEASFTRHNGLWLCLVIQKSAETYVYLVNFKSSIRWIRLAARFTKKTVVVVSCIGVVKIQRTLIHIIGEFQVPYSYFVDVFA